MPPFSKRTFISLAVLVGIVGIAYEFFVYYPEFLLRDVEGYRYIKWVISDRRGSEGLCIDRSCIQATQFTLLQKGVEVVWPNETSVVNPNGSNPIDEDPGNLIDGTVDTKWVDNRYSSVIGYTEGESTVVIDAGPGNFIVFDGYTWSTANDEIDRDPVSWKLYASKNRTFWQLLDTRVHVPLSEDRSVFTGNYTVGRGKERE